MSKEKGTVKCDKCNWREFSEDIASWYQVPCPKCKDSIIVDEDDMEMLKGIAVLREEGLVLPNNTKRKDVIMVRIDSKAIKDFLFSAIIV